MSDEQPGAVMAATTTCKTMADGTLRVCLDIEPRHAQAAFALFGAPGTSVALARLRPEAALSQSRKETIEHKPDYGKCYQILYRAGWFYSPRVGAAFGLTAQPTDQRPDQIKNLLHDGLGVESLADVGPEEFRAYLTNMGIGDTLPRGFGQL